MILLLSFHKHGRRANGSRQHPITNQARLISSGSPSFPGSPHQIRSDKRPANKQRGGGAIRAGGRARARRLTVS